MNEHSMQEKLLHLKKKDAQGIKVRALKACQFQQTC